MLAGSLGNVVLATVMYYCVHSVAARAVFFASGSA
jgi:hypothetical protein